MWYIYYKAVFFGSIEIPKTLLDMSRNFFLSEDILKFNQCFLNIKLKTGGFEMTKNDFNQKTTSRKFISILLFMSMMVSLMVQIMPITAVEAETENKPIIISTAEELKSFCDGIGKTENSSYSGKTIELGCDIDCSSISNWNPIDYISESASPQPFSGTFDGKGHEIKNLTISGSNAYSAALFASNNGTIKNLGIVNANISGATYIGGICYENEGTIENCYFRGSITAGTDNGSIAGGICTQTGYYNSFSAIKNCYSAVDFNGVGSKGVGTPPKICGIANYSGGRLTNCYYKTQEGITFGDSNNGAVAQDASYFSSGGIAYSLQSGQGSPSEQVWGQKLGANGDEYPKFTSDEDENVYKITYQIKQPNLDTSKDYIGYSNKSRRILPPLFAADEYSTGFVYNDVEFTDSTEISEDITVTMKVSPYFTQTTDVPEISGVYGKMIDVDLNKYYAHSDSSIDNNENFEFEVVRGELPKGMTLENKHILKGRLLYETDVTLSAVDKTDVAVLNDDGQQSGNATLTLKFSPSKEITTAENLKDFAEAVNGGYDYSGETITLGGDINLSSVCGAGNGNWTPIGTTASPFKGIFDGGKHTVSGLYIDVDSRDYNKALFGYITGGAVIKNLKVEGYVRAFDHTAGICVVNDNSTIQNCISNVEVLPVTTDNTIYAGNICSDNKGSIKNCISIANFSSLDNPNVYGIACNGTDNNISIENCYYIKGKDNNGGLQKTEDEFKSGEITWLLQNGQDELIWGQNLGTDGLSKFTDNESERVCKVEFHTKNAVAETKYVNKGKKTDLPSKPSVTNYKFDKWLVRDTNTEFNADMEVDGDLVLDAYGFAEFTVEETNIELTYGQEVNIDLKQFVKFKDSSAENEFTFILAENQTLPSGLTLENGIISGSVNADANNEGYQTTFEISEKAALMDLNPEPKTSAVNITLTFKVDAKTITPSVEPVSEQEYTGSEVTPDVVVKDGGKTLVKDTDYTVSYENNTDMTIDADGNNVGNETKKPTVKVTLKGNYSGSKDVNFEIKENRHNYKPEWTWKDDGSAAVLKLVCENDSGHKVENLSATVTSEVLQTAECTKKGKTKYTAEYTYGGTEYSDTKEIEDIAELGHSYKPEWTWKDDGSAAVLKLVCENDSSHTAENLSAEVKSEVLQAADCTQKGKTKYTAEYTYEGTKYSDTKEIEDINATGHTYDTKWSSDLTHHWHSAVCKHTNEVKDKAEHIWNGGETTKPAQIGVKGEKTYTCTVCGAVKTEEIDAPEPTSAPTTEVTSAPITEPTSAPTTEVTSAPTTKPTSEPTTGPTSAPTTKPTSEPTTGPTSAPTTKPTSEPTESTTEPTPVEKPTLKPTPTSVEKPTLKPTPAPVARPTLKPTPAPVEKPTLKPIPTTEPTAKPTLTPTTEPTAEPTLTPTEEPTPTATVKPTKKPSSGGGGGGGGHIPTYSVTVEKSGNGTITADPTRARSGVSVTVTVNADEGNELTSFFVRDANAKDIEVKKNTDGTYTFVQPESNVTVNGIFKENEKSEPNDKKTGADNNDKKTVTGHKECNRRSDCPAYYFTDLDLSMWYHDGIHFCVGNEYMNGMDKYKFEPDTITTRAMIVTILYRMENEPKISGNTVFSDVKPNKYYRDAVEWASENSIVEGVGDGTFAPETAITREQLSAILYRYAKYKKYNTSAGDSVKSYDDIAEVSDWAVEAINWAVENEIVQGDGDRLMPKGDGTRAQSAAMIQRFCDMFI